MGCLADYLIYTVGLVWANPMNDLPLFQYLDIIYKLYSYFTGLVWLQHDKEFCMSMASYLFTCKFVFSLCHLPILTHWRNFIVRTLYRSWFLDQEPFLRQGRWFKSACSAWNLIPRAPATHLNRPFCRRQPAMGKMNKSPYTCLLSSGS